MVTPSIAVLAENAGWAAVGGRPLGRWWAVGPGRRRSRLRRLPQIRTCPI